MILLLIAKALLITASFLDFDFRTQMTRASYTWALFQGGTFNYREDRYVRKEFGRPAWPVYVMWAC